MRQFFAPQRVTFAALLVLSMTTALAAADHSHAPKFGGVVIETKVGDMEIVAKPDSITVYVSDHGKPMKLDGSKAKVTLLNGTEKAYVDLVLAGDKLEAKGDFKVAKGTKGIVVLMLAGKPPATARFDIK